MTNFTQDIIRENKADHLLEFFDFREEGETLRCIYLGEIDQTQMKEFNLGLSIISTQIRPVAFWRKFKLVRIEFPQSGSAMVIDAKTDIVLGMERIET